MKRILKRKRQMLLKGTKLYKNKILGLRGRATGLIFSNFQRKKDVISKEKVNRMKFIQFTVRLYTAYS
nr:MAG TPA_asm: hypothetical protein [Caudoviricetes sp.]